MKKMYKNYKKILQYSYIFVEVLLFVPIDISTVLQTDAKQRHDCDRNDITNKRHCVVCTRHLSS